MEIDRAKIVDKLLHPDRRTRRITRGNNADSPSALAQTSHTTCRNDRHAIDLWRIGIGAVEHARWSISFRCRQGASH